MTEGEFDVYVEALPQWNARMQEHFPKEIEGNKCIFTGWKLELEYDIAAMKSELKSSCLRAQVAIKVGSNMFMYVDASGSSGTLHNGELMPTGTRQLPVIGSSFSELLALAKGLWYELAGLYEKEYGSKGFVAWRSCEAQVSGVAR